MFFKIVITSLFVLSLFDSAQATLPIYKDASHSPADRASDLLAQMTWEEKVGQLGGIRQILQAKLAFNQTLFDSIHSLQNGMIGMRSS